jgi:hypothetical protein
MHRRTLLATALVTPGIAREEPVYRCIITGAGITVE